MPNEQTQSNKPQINGCFSYFFVAVFLVLIASGCSVSNKLTNPGQQNQTEAVIGLSSRKETSINEKSTDTFMYLDMGRNFEVSEEHFKVFDVIKPGELMANNTECGFGKNFTESKKDEQYFEQLLSGYTQNDMGTVYSFAYDGQSQEGDWRLTIIPNKLGYSNIDRFKNDFDVCFAGADRIPSLISENYLLFMASCSTGFDDGSGLVHGCYEMEQIIKSTITLR